jgi:hypothetical protein
MKLEAIVTCVDYADFLAHTLPLNKPHFDRIIVVTAPEDRATIDVCDFHSQPYYRTDAFRSRWGEFRKGTAINEGLAKLDRDSWMVHLDADIILPSHFRQAVETASLDTSMIYGCDRVECQSFEEWQRFYGAPTPQIQGNGVFIHTTHSPFKFGTRVQFPDAGGWIPIGFFQMWHADSKVLTYPEGHTNAGREDSLFPKQWPRAKRAFLPEIIVYHLESQNAPMAVNWSGRKTIPFGPPGMKLPQHDAAERKY